MLHAFASCAYGLRMLLKHDLHSFVLQQQLWTAMLSRETETEKLRDVLVIHPTERL